MAPIAPNVDYEGIRHFMWSYSISKANHCFCKQVRSLPLLLSFSAILPGNICCRLCQVTICFNFVPFSSHHASSINLATPVFYMFHLAHNSPLPCNLVSLALLTRLESFSRSTLYSTYSLSFGLQLALLQPCRCSCESSHGTGISKMLGSLSLDWTSPKASPGISQWTAAMPYSVKPQLLSVNSSFLQWLILTPMPCRSGRPKKHVSLCVAVIFQIENPLGAFSNDPSNFIK